MIIPYSYFGARYYDSDLSVWLSVDPMAKQRPSISPYNYCLYNPMNKVDPNGLIEVDPDKGASKIKGAVKPLVIKAKTGGYNDATSAALKFHKGQGDADFYDNKPKEPASTALPEAKPAEQKQTGSTGSTQSTPSLLTKIDAGLFGGSSWGNAEGHNDGANTGNISKQDRIVGGGIAGGLTGIGAIIELGIAGASLTAYLIPTLTTVNSIDDSFTNSKGESGFQQLTSNESTKQSIGATKFFVGILSVSSSMKQPIQTLQSPYRTIGTAIDINSVNNYPEKK